MQLGVLTVTAGASQRWAAGCAAFQLSQQRHERTGRREGRVGGTVAKKEERKNNTPPPSEKLKS